MHGADNGRWPSTDVIAPRRNHFFYGKLMDAYHFELETSYVNSKRWLLNRLNFGSGVVCGLDVYPPEADPAHRHGDGPRPEHQVVITPGVAIDGWGREIVVPAATTVNIPWRIIRDARQTDRQGGSGGSGRSGSGYGSGGSEGGPGGGYGPGQAGGQSGGYGSSHEEHDEEDEEDHDDDSGWVNVSICYHECLEDPTAVLAGDCHSAQACEPGTVREAFSLAFAEGKAPRNPLECHIENVLSTGRVNYETIVNWFTEGCPDPPEDPCVTLANIWIGGANGHECNKENIDIYVRPIVPTNLLLFEMFLDHVRDQRHGSQTTRPARRGNP